jgi:hypothetical protein
MKPATIICISGFIPISLLVIGHYFANPNGDLHLGTMVYVFEALLYLICHIIGFAFFLMRRRWIEENSRLDFRSIGFTAFVLFFSNVFTYYLITALFTGLAINAYKLLGLISPALVGIFAAGTCLYVYRKKWV